MSINLKYSKSVIKDYKKLSDGRKEYIKRIRKRTGMIWGIGAVITRE